jgi:hypothetical protein
MMTAEDQEEEEKKKEGRVEGMQRGGWDRYTYSRSVADGKDAAERMD